MRRVEMRCVNASCGLSRSQLLAVVSSTGSGVVEIRCPKCKHTNKFVMGAQGE